MFQARIGNRQAHLGEIGGNRSGQQRPAGNELADVHAFLGDATGIIGRVDFGAVVVAPGLFELRLGHLDLRENIGLHLCGPLEILHCPVELHLGHLQLGREIGLHLLRPLAQILPRLVERGLLGLHIGRGLGHLWLVLGERRGLGQRAQPLEVGNGRVTPGGFEIQCRLGLREIGLRHGHSVGVAGALEFFEVQRHGGLLHIGPRHCDGVGVTGPLNLLQFQLGLKLVDGGHRLGDGVEVIGAIKREQPLAGLEEAALLEAGLDGNNPAGDFRNDAALRARLHAALAG